MASLLHKLLKKSPPPLRFLTALNNPQFPKLPLFPFPYQNAIPKTDPNLPLPSYPVRERVVPSSFDHPFQIYPSFPLYHLDLVSLPGPDLLDADRDDVVGSSVGSDRTVWADSVKKKRKRKMNKHKYKKLRKRLRRQT